MKNGKCPPGKYYCYTDKVCKDIPAGFMVDPQGMLRKENGASVSEAAFSHKTPHLKRKQHQLDPNLDLKQLVHHATVQYVDRDADGDVDVYDKPSKKTPDENPTDINVASTSKKLLAKQKGEIKHTKRGVAYEETKSGDSSLHDWFSKSKSSDGKPGWVQLGGKYAGKPCAKQPGQTTKPKCGSSKMKRSLSKDEEQRAFLRKNRQDPNPERSGKAINVKTEEKDHEYSMARSELSTIMNAAKRLKKKMGKGEGNIEAWVQSKITKAADYLDSAADYVNSGEMSEEKDACYHKVKSRYKVWPSAYASGALVKCRKVGADSWGNKTKKEGFTPSQIAALESIGAIEINEAGKKCWKGYKKVGTQKLFGKTYNRCEKEGYAHEDSSGQTDLSHVSEAVTVPRQNGQVMSVMLVFRGKFYMMQLFFPTLQVPTKQEVTAAVQKIYPDARVTQYFKSTVDPTQPLIRISEQQDDSEEKQAQQIARRQLMLNRQKIQLQAKAVQKKKGTDMMMQTEEKKCSHTSKGKSCPVHGENECPDEDDLDEAVAAWQRKEGKNQSGGLNEKGRKSYERENPGSDLKAPSKKVGNPRRASFCARMRGMKAKLTSAKTARDPDSRINKSLRAWNC